MDGQKVVVAGARIDPVAGRDHLVRGQRGDDIVHHFLLAEAQLAGANPVNLEPQGRVIDILRNVDLAHARQVADLTRQIGGDSIG